MNDYQFICEGVSIEDNVLIGRGVIFINDTHSRATKTEGALQPEADWQTEVTHRGN